MNNYNDNDRPTISAQENVDTLDLIGRILVAYASNGLPVDSITASSLAILASECRVYSTVRDQESLTDENSRSVIDALNQTKTYEQDLSDAADSIIADLRNSGINI